jgi:hypothetical protein
MMLVPGQLYKHFRDVTYGRSKISGNAALSIMTFSIITLSVMTLSIMTLSIMTHSIMTLSIMTLSITTFSITVNKMPHSAL